MGANDFVTWLHGFVEACGETLTREQCDTLRGRLNKFEENKRDHEKQVVLLQEQAFLARQEAKLKAVEAELEQAERKREPATGKSYKEITKQIEEDAKKERAKLTPDRPTHLSTGGISWGGSRSA